MIKSHLILRVIQMSEPRYEARIFEIQVSNFFMREKQNFGFFDKLPYLYGKPFVAQKKIIKQKMQGAGSFVARKKISKIKALSLTVKKLWLKNLKNEYP